MKTLRKGKELLAQALEIEQTKVAVRALTNCDDREAAAHVYYWLSLGLAGGRSQEVSLRAAVEHLQIGGPLNHA